jgi:hypothetical protein
MESRVQQIRSRGYWEILIRPAHFVARRVDNIADLFPIVRDRAVQISGWDFPHIDRNAKPGIGQDWIEQEVDWHIFVERWRIYQSGQFVFIGGFQGEWDDPDYPRSHLPPHYPVLTIEDALRKNHETFTFAQRLALSPAGDARLTIRITAHQLAGRHLHTCSPNRMGFIEPRVAQIPQFVQEAEFEKELLLSESANLAGRWATELFRRFGWDPAPTVLESIRREISP